MWTEKTAQPSLLLSTAMNTIRQRTIEKISQAFIACSSVDSFAQQVVDITRENFKFYFVSLWILDKKEQKIHFRTGTGELGRVMRERKFHVSTESKGMVATSVRENKVVIDAWSSRGGHLLYSLPLNAQKVSKLLVEFVEESIRPSPLFPSSSEIIVPLRTTEKPIGALDIHSDRKDDFD